MKESEKMYMSASELTKILSKHLGLKAITDVEMSNSGGLKIYYYPDAQTSGEEQDLQTN